MIKQLLSYKNTHKIVFQTFSIAFFMQSTIYYYLCVVGMFFLAGCANHAEAPRPEKIDVVQPGSNPSEVNKDQDTLPENAMIKAFPWPPPRASATFVLNKTQFKKAENLGGVDEILEKALSKTGYYDKSYYTVPNGFAVATKLEQINKDASPKKVPDRWSAKVDMQNFTFSEYISSLFTSKPGYFRVIVFVITDNTFRQKKSTVERTEAEAWVSDGAQSLPPEMLKRSFTANHTVTALIYEYEVPENSKKAQLIAPSKHTAREHLVKSKLYVELTR